MKALVSSLVAATTLLGLLAGPVTATQRPPGSQAPDINGLHGGSRSAQDLVQKFLRALRKKDPDALRNLRVTEAEYREIIVPGSAKPGEPPRKLVPDWIEFAWGSLNEKSRHNERALVATLGGKDLTLREMAFDGGEQQYRGYKAYRLLRLQLSDGGQEDLSIETGSIAEVRGRYKFIAFGRD